MVTKGQKLAKQRRFKLISSGLAGILVAVLSIFGVTQIFNNADDGSKVKTASKKVETKVKGITETRTTDPVTEAPNENSVDPSQTQKPVAEKIVPTYISILKYGDAGICTPPLPGPGEVNTGTAIAYELWNPSKEEATTISAGDPAHDIVLTNLGNKNATNGAYVELSSGFNRNNSHADVSTLGFLYCEDGYKLEIKSAGANRGYILTTERW